MEPRTWLTAKEAAARLGVHYLTLLRYVRQDMLPASRIGKLGKLRIESAEVNKLLEK